MSSTPSNEVKGSDAEPAAAMGGQLIPRDRAHPTDRNAKSPARWLFALGAIALLAALIYFMVSGGPR